VGLTVGDRYLIKSCESAKFIMMIMIIMMMIIMMMIMSGFVERVINRRAIDQPNRSACRCR